MSIDEYVPSEDDVRETWVAHESKCAWGPYPGDPTADFDRFLARVRRDAAREALDGLINERRTAHDEAATSNRVGGMVLELHAQQVATKYRDTHYSEESP